MSVRLVAGLALACSLLACRDDELTIDETPGGAVTVSGRVIDFETGAALTSAASITTSGLVPAPTVVTSGSEFTISNVVANSAFQILAGAPPSHRTTFGPSIVVTDSDVDGVDVPVVSEAFLGRIAAGFGVTPTAAKGVLFVQLRDDQDQPLANIAGSNLIVTGAVGPKFLSANLEPLPNATASTTSGWAVFFEVPTGVVALAQAAAPTLGIDMATSPVNAGVVTIAHATIAQGAQQLPANVSFSAQVFPIFKNRGCVACHSGGGIGKDLGGLHLDGGANLAYRELVEERPGLRVNLTMPEKSLVLTHPSREDPPDRHPNVTFASASDPDYLEILVWIREGATNN